MRSDRTSTFILIQTIVALTLLWACVVGSGTLHWDGLHIRKLAYDNIAFAVLGVLGASLLTAIVLLVFFAADPRRSDASAFLYAWLVGVLAHSAFVNATGEVTLNGHSLRWFTWPAGVIVIVLLAWFGLAATRERSTST